MLSYQEVSDGGFNGSFSNWLCVLSGAPKGSVFRPLLFLFYIYDIHQSIYYGVALMLTDVICKDIVSPIHAS